MEEKVPVKMIKKDAIVTIQIGTVMIQKLQQAVAHVVKGITEEDMTKYQQEVVDFEKILKQEKSFSESWMDAAFTLTLLLKEIEDKASEQKLTYEVDLQDYIKSIDPTSVDSQSSDQSQLQPE